MGKRDYDRKSGDNRTGIKAEDKRGGGGKGNWGTFEDDVPKEGEEANTTVDSEGKEEAAVEEEPKAPRELTAEELEAKLAREEEEKQMTLDEWKKLQAKKEGPKFNLRKAGEGSDVDPKWKKATIYKKENEVEVKEAEVAAVERDGDAERAVDVAKDVGPEEAVANPAENSASTRRLSPPWGNEE